MVGMNNKFVSPSQMAKIAIQAFNRSAMEIPEEDLKIWVELVNPSAGGQMAGSPRQYVCIEHIPTKTIVKVNSGRSQHKNRQIGLLMIEFALVEMGYNYS